MFFEKYDVIIVGAGVSGLYTALNLDKSLKILMLSKKGSAVCNSAMAQGGVAAVMDKIGDDFELHIKDTLIAGGYENNRENLKILVEHGPENIEKLIRFGVAFDKNADGGIALTLEGGHSRRRIAHHKDSTGQEVVTVLAEKAKALENVTCLENAHLLGLEKKGGIFYADVSANDEHCYYTTTVCVFATGGIGRVYDFTTNSSTATGDGIYFAHKLGADIKKMSYIQFHPTAFADKSSRECFLISEAVRGEGAYLYNCDKERFMERYEPERKELAPRDVVSRCIIEEEKRTGSGDFYLDISHKSSDFIKERFPMIYARLLEKGYDLTKEPVPIYPCQHYLMGGIAVDGNGVTSVKGLYAAGECAHTGVHGMNRLASNSLLEALVFSRLVAEHINVNPPRDCGGLQADFAGFSGLTDFSEMKGTGKTKPEGVRTEIRRIMQKAFFVEPDYGEVKKGLARVGEIKALLESSGYELTPDFAEARSLVTVAELVLSDVTDN